MKHVRPPVPAGTKPVMRWSPIAKGLLLVTPLWAVIGAVVFWVFHK